MASERMRAICWPWNRSRMTARPSTAPAPAPKPWTSRMASSVSMLPLSAQPSVVAMNTAVPASIAGLRP